MLTIYYNNGAITRLESVYNVIIKTLQEIHSESGKVKRE